MQTITEITDLADLRLAEARTLLQAGLHHGAFYLAGYSLELYLKARICRVLGVQDVFSTGFSNSKWAAPFRTHDYDKLLFYGGLLNPKETDQNQDVILRLSWDIVDQLKWNESYRHHTPNPTSHSSQDVLEFINSIDYITNRWLRQHYL